ncbi:GNAT family N-acetyltransferase [Paenibacillus frigoriresistens]|uniref:GNAT family N-acetyltransferase n=1 Tax=Paenibacillus alginolyticus TaxID=59839 RepID=UPI0015632931|nr:GNAT family N-acetyltransferase [Paenibacillus frigoriresistens]NRF94560.1 GNAT family N-acetyltransferase [Paenibacillus frigoriresistens]
MYTSLKLEEFQHDNLNIISEIVNSNPSYNKMENGQEHRTHEELIEELYSPDQCCRLIKDVEETVGFILFLEKNPNDGFPWLGLLMIHANYKRKGYGKAAFRLLEKHLKEQRCSTVRIGILKANQPAKIFWQSLGFTYYDTKISNLRLEVDCYEKYI